jgi:hypothetical protein
MTNEEIEAKLGLIEQLLNSHEDLLRFYGQKIGDLSVDMSILKMTNTDKPPMLVGAESTTFQYNVNDKFEILFFNDIDYVCRIQLKTVVTNGINYIKMYKDNKLLPNVFTITNPLLPVNITVTATNIKFATTTYSLLPTTTNANFVKVNKLT